MIVCRLKVQSALALILLTLVLAPGLVKTPARADFTLQDVSRPLATAFLIPLIYGGSGHTDGYTAEDLRCLALNIYWEARSESLRGQPVCSMTTVRSP